MKNILLYAVLMLTLTGCPGGWRTVMTSEYSLTPPPPGIKEYPRYTGVTAPAVTLDDTLLLQWGSSNYHDLGYKEPVDAPYHI
ncbi:MAG: membrane lipoprotein lipid attachment site-containing protein, partial [Gammaproteobacteria bacterium]